jgi:hypothetical protein
MTDNQKLKPCPFCGGEVIDRECGFAGEFIDCLKCSKKFYVSKEEWNNRPVEDDLRNQLKRAREALFGMSKALSSPTSGAEIRAAMDKHNQAIEEAIKAKGE